ncbi:hypothetical protein RFI_21690 [Reticulomyxa filosa]|uniref:RanBP2-type domain-containing protein n=1 Tax=Reticulomyxa filosa TaxID=46433 RepID=X6MQF2_RETFI|nr:hypothetical protein RFI_21690 [Reticulomyxa filosa]|eukprot:ETO15672.1 hypothetical protein RFI_21690 [Reticulomyxa filosa]
MAKDVLLPVVVPSHECWVKLSYPEVCPLVEFEVFPIHPDLGLSFWLIRFLLQSVVIKSYVEASEYLHSVHLCVRMIQLLFTHWKLAELQVSPLKQALLSLTFQILATIDTLVRKHKQDLMNADTQALIDQGLEELKQLSRDTDDLFDTESVSEVTAYFQLLIDVMVLADKLRSHSCKQVSKVSFGGADDKEGDEEEDDGKEDDKDAASKEWDCPVCTLKNPFEEDKCGLCGSSRPPIKAKAKRDTKGMSAGKVLQQMVALSSAIEFFRNINVSRNIVIETLFKAAWNSLKAESDPSKQWFLINNVPPGPDDKVKNIIRQCVTRIESDTRVCIGHIHLGTDPQASKPVTRYQKYIQKSFYPGPNPKEFDDRGIMYFLGTGGKGGPWKNPSDDKLINIRVKNLAPSSKSPNASYGSKPARWMTKSEINSFIVFDFGERRVCPSFYKLRHYSHSDRDALRYWRLEGCQESSYALWGKDSSGRNDQANDIDSDSKWEILSEHRNEEAFKKGGQVEQWKIPDDQSHKYFHKFRIIITGPNSSGNFVLALSAFELYGVLEMPPSTTPNKQKTHRFAIVEVTNASNDVSQALLSMNGMQVKAPPGVESEFLEKEVLAPLPQISSPPIRSSSVPTTNASSHAIEKKDERYVIEPIISELQVVPFAELPDSHIAKDAFLKDLFLTIAEKGSEVDGTDKNASKEQLRNPWPELFDKILFGEEEEEEEKTKREGMMREDFSKKISPSEEMQELISSLCEQLDINDPSEMLTRKQLHDVLMLLIKVNPKLVFDWVFANGYDHYGTKRFNSNFDIALTEQYAFQENKISQHPQFDILFMKYCTTIAEKLGFYSLQQLKPMYLRHVSAEEVQSDPSLRELFAMKDETPIEMLRLRFSAFQYLNAVIAKVLAFVDLSRYEMPSSLAHLLCIAGND